MARTGIGVRKVVDIFFASVVHHVNYNRSMFRPPIASGRKSPSTHSVLRLYLLLLLPVVAAVVVVVAVAMKSVKVVLQLKKIHTCNGLYIYLLLSKRAN